MPTELKYLSARRSFEFEPDEIRLSVLSNAEIVGRIRQAFAFQVGQISTPMPTFGPVANTIPPGLVFDYGVARLGPDFVVPIRFLHFEQRRVVLDIAGPSEAIAPIFEALRGLLQNDQAPDGSPAIGSHARIRDYSELTYRLGFDPEQFLAPQLRPILAEFSAAGGIEVGSVSPKLEVRLALGEKASEVDVAPTQPYLRLEPRLGRSASDRWYFSVAPLDTVSHLALLNDIEKAVVGRGDPTRRTTRARGGNKDQK
jgi:hypothetical protein